jgi:preprotein translocase subunit SecF
VAREIDPARRNALKQTVAAHPGMVVFALSPAIVVFGVLWLLTNFWLALIVGLIVGGGAAWALLRR